MNAAEIKIDLFRRLDNLDNNRLEEVYNKIINLINTDPQKNTVLSPEIKTALDEALEASEQGMVYTHEKAVQKTKEKYPNLFK